MRRTWRASTGLAGAPNRTRRLGRRQAVHGRGAGGGMAIPLSLSVASSPLTTAACRAAEQADDVRRAQQRLAADRRERPASGQPERFVSGGCRGGGGGSTRRGNAVQHGAGGGMGLEIVRSHVTDLTEQVAEA